MLRTEPFTCTQCRATTKLYVSDLLQAGALYWRCHRCQRPHKTLYKWISAEVLTILGTWWIYATDCPR